MTFFDLLFLAVVLTSIASFSVAGYLLVRGRRAQALRIERIHGLCAVGYLAIATTVACWKPQHVIAAEDPWCFDDWCLQVQRVQAMPVGSNVSYHVNFRFYSIARRISQHAPDGATVYLIDSQGHRYSPKPDPSAAPLTALLKPEQSINTSRVFEVPGGVRSLGLVHQHGSSYCGFPGILIIWEGGCLFDKPTMIRIRSTDVE
jgi:hypothetical protein